MTRKGKATLGPPGQGWRQLLPSQAATRRGALVAATYYALILLPAVVVDVPSMVLRIYWLASSLALATTILWLYARRGTVRVAALALNALAAIGNLMFALSLAIQGTGFNAQFFYHMDWDTILASRNVFAPAGIVGAAYWLIVCLWLRLLPEAGLRPAPSGWTRAVVVALVVAATLNVAAISAAWHVGAEILRGHRIVLVPKTRQPVASQPLPEPRNLVLVAAESLEATYARSDLFGIDLTPNLTALAADAVRFTDMRQVSHTGWTTGAFVAALCGESMAPASYWKQWTLDLDARMHGAVCLGDVLEAHGYRTVYMGGARLEFGSKGTFLAAHGFSERHGLRSLSPRLADPSYRNGWGLFDDSLLAMARERLRELPAGEEPFALVVLTMDTHFPPGFPSASCGTPADTDDRAFVIRCADRLVASFISDVRTAHPDAVVALFSDHLSQESPDRAGLLPPGVTLGDNAGILGMVDARRNQGVRRLRFAIWDHGLTPAVIDRPGTHFDIMPTVLDALGLDGWASHRFGTSLLRDASPWLAHPNPDALQTVYDMPLRLPSGGEVTFDTNGPAIEIHGHRMLATGRGLAFEDAVFAVAFAEDGTVLRILDSEGFDALIEHGASPPVVGISTRQDVNRRLLGDVPRVLFTGRPGAADFLASALPAAEQRTVVTIRY